MVRTEKSAHAYSRGKYSGSFVVWDASDSQAKSRLAAESFGYNRSSWLPPFLAGFSPRDRKRRKWRRFARMRFSLSFSLCLLLLLVPERCIPTTIDVCTQKDQRWGFSTYGPVKTYTAPRNLSLESAMIRRRSGRCLFSFCGLDLFLANECDAVKWRTDMEENWYSIH